MRGYKRHKGELKEGDCAIKSIEYAYLAPPARTGLLVCMYYRSKSCYILAAKHTWKHYHIYKSGIS